MPAALPKHKIIDDDVDQQHDATEYDLDVGRQPRRVNDRRKIVFDKAAFIPRFAA